VLVTLQSIWTKRTILAAVSRRKADGLEGPHIRDDHPISPEYKRAKNEARLKNQEEKDRADQENREVRTSYSARQDGTILKFVKNGGKWVRLNVPEEQNDAAQ
jgi:hypothetical protein